MDPEIIKTINKKVVQRFPEMQGVKPKIHRRQSPQAKSSHKNNRIDEKLSYLITYRNTVKGSNGNNIPRWVRVVVDRRGRILKITTSR